MQAFYTCGKRELLSSGVQAFHWSGFSCCRIQALERRLCSCGVWALRPYGMWNLPGPGIEPMSPVLAGVFLITGPPWKPLTFSLIDPQRTQVAE